MAISRRHLPGSVDETDAAIARVLEDPKLRAELEAEERIIESGDYVGIPHEEAMRVLGFDSPPVKEASTPDP